MSATWYTWIEQGRDVSASPTALGRLAQVLQPRAPSAPISSSSPAAATRHGRNKRRWTRHPRGAALLAAIAQPAYVLDRT